MPRIEGNHTCCGEVRANLRKELTSGELKWYVGLLEGIYRYNIILLMGGIHKCPSVLLIDMKIGFVHIKIFAPHVHDGRVNFNPVYRYRPINLSILMGNRATCESNN